MPYTPPFRTRRGTQRQVEPHLGDPDAPASTLTWTTAASRPLADDPTLVPEPEPVEDDDDALPVLTQLIEPPADPVQPAPPAAESPAPVPSTPAPAAPVASAFLPDPPVDEPDEELVARITDEVLDDLQPALHELVSDAIRRALKDHARNGG